MPPRSEETAPLTLISVLLVESGEALRRYADSYQNQPFSPDEMGQLASAWKGVGEVLADIAASPAVRSPDQLTTIATGLTTVRDILRRQTAG